MKKTLPTQPCESSQMSHISDTSSPSLFNEESERLTASEVSQSIMLTDSTDTTDTTESPASTAQPKSTRVGKQQRKLEFAEYKETFLAPKDVANRHQVSVSEETSQILEYYKRVLGYRETTITGYVDAIIAGHFKDYKSDLESWRKL